ncbi:MAG: hypothetical protein GY803_04750 [Chloroflexi bacterium]|nr:hypothetical protein [Chloroflexota bacterium]
MDKQETAAEVNIEEIMRDIRADILAKRAAVGSGGEPLVPTSGKRLPPEFYEHMYQAALAYENVGVKMHVTKVNIPLLGGIIEWLRGKMHELTLYYVNQVASQQTEVNYHLLRALAIASQELETEHDEHT